MTMLTRMVMCQLQHLDQSLALSFEVWDLFIAIFALLNDRYPDKVDEASLNSSDFRKRV